MLHPKQWVAKESKATEILYGGAAGGGKSHLMRAAAIGWCADIPGLQVYLFRRQYTDLILNHVEGPKGFRALLAPWVAMRWCSIVDDEIRFWNGSKIYLCHCHNEVNVYDYHGAEMHVLIIDEVTHFSEHMYRVLRSRNRMVGINTPPQYEGMFPRILCGGNPGNIGHLWVKNTWITDCPPAKIRRMPNSEGGMLRQFIPARLEDNPSMATDDPLYEAKLEGLGSATLVAAMRWGDWDVVEGAFFDCWSNHKHVIQPFTIPEEWLRFRSADWGSASPFSIGWWAVVQDDFTLADRHTGAPKGMGKMGSQSLGSGVLPRGALVRYREDYGKSAPNKGLKLTAEEVANRIVEREKNDPKLGYGVLDPSTFKEDGGPSIAERINTVLVKARIASFREADNSRVSRIQSRDRGGPMGGWDALRARMVGNDGVPMIYWFSTCLDSIRTIPVLQHDPHRAEDLDTHSEDHAADDSRYAVLSRPWLRSPPEKKEPKDAYQTAQEQMPDDSMWKTM